jgi:hypothetical protein
MSMRMFYALLQKCTVLLFNIPKDFMVDPKMSQATTQLAASTVAFFDPAFWNGNSRLGAMLVVTVSTAATATVEIVFKEFLLFVREFL